MNKRKEEKAPEPKQRETQQDKLFTIKQANTEGVYRANESKRQQVEARIT